MLHGVALMLILARLLAPWRTGLWLAGLVALVLPRLVQHPIFDPGWLNWTGLVTKKPITEDYVPVLPWLGVMLWGLAAGQWLLARAGAAGPLVADDLHAAPAAVDRRGAAVPARCAEPRGASRRRILVTG